MSAECRPVESDSDGVTLFDDVYREHHQPLYAYLRGHTRNDDVAADLLQETFLRVWRHIHDLRQVPAIRRRFWLFAIAGNIVKDHYRRRAVRERYEVALQDGIPRATDPMADPARALEAKETQMAVDAAIERLPEDLRIVLTMYLIAEMTGAEIAVALGRPAGTVRYQIARARRLVAEELGLVSDSAEKGENVRPCESKTIR